MIQRKKQHQKYTFLVRISVTLLLVFASSNAPAFSNGGAFYAGLFYGITNPVMTGQLNQVITADSDVILIKFNSNQFPVQQIDGMDLGYGYFHNNYYFGIEIGKNFIDSKIDTTFFNSW